MIIPIDDPADPRVAPFRDVRERDVAGRRGGFIAEGTVVLGMLARSRLYRARSLLIARERVARLGPLIDRFDATTPVFSAAQPVMDAIAGFSIHRGVLAFGERGEPARAADLLAGLSERALVVVLIGVSNHDNVGGVFRNAAAFGADAVLLDATCCDPLYRKAIRVSAGAALRVPFAFLGEDEDPIDLIAAQDLTPIALSPGGARPLRALAALPRAAILLGAEGHGLPASVLERAETLAIEMADGVDSLNLAVASGIALHHLAFGKGERPC